MLSLDFTYSMEIIPLESSCLTVLCRRRMCRDLPLYIRISSRKWRSHSASSPALSRAMNSDSIIDLAMQVCLEDFQDTVAPPRVKTYPLVDFESLVSDIQFVSQYPSSTAGYLV